MTDEGAYNLLIAITERAYKDYWHGLKLIKKYGGILPHDSKLKTGELVIAKNYKTAKIFLEDTEMGEYLMGKAKMEVYHVKF